MVKIKLLGLQYNRYPGEDMFRTTKIYVGSSAETKYEQAAKLILNNKANSDIKVTHNYSKLIKFFGYSLGTVISLQGIYKNREDAEKLTNEIDKLL